MDKNLSILVVDADPIVMEFMAVILGEMGYTVVRAATGEKALDLFRRRQPDMALVDVIMPGIGGHELVREMRRIARDWLPIVFLTSLGESEEIVKGIEAGGDDYLLKPVSFQILQAKINSLGERLRLGRQLVEQNRLLLEFQMRTEEEQAIASGYMQKLIALDTLHDAAVEFYLKPTDNNFCGDLIAVERTPEGRLHILLADSTGHGLSAALAAIPVVNPFYSMTKSGFGISAIAREMNNMVWDSLPTSHFVAAILVCINPYERMIEVWSGGCPPPLVLNSKGDVVKRFSPRHLALGILPNKQFDDTLEYFINADDDDCSLLMFSDGLTDMKNMQGETFSLDQLLDSLIPVPASERWQNLRASVDQFSAGLQSAGDDISIVMAKCQSMHVQVQEQGKVGETGKTQAQGAGRLVWQFVLSLSVEQIKKLEVVPFLLEIIQQIDKDGRYKGRIFMILSELFNNALDHGLLKLDSTLSPRGGGMEKYFDERSRCLAAIKTGQINFSLKKIIYDEGGAQLVINVRDTGDGFDHRQAAKNNTAEAPHHGNGIGLLKKLCSSVEYMGNGSEVLAFFDMPDAE
jgi:two-component system, HptB-dependent secretion and biofilm response regulator